ncbi:MAG: leucyl aminopeptidase [Candidatus Eisenbacteria bacterium]|nr:leucyl aminopeptidase [Candidatus Eisenbacteria bacterium]
MRGEELVVEAKRLELGGHAGSAADVRADLVCLGLWQGESLSEPARAVDRAVEGRVSDAVSAGGFKGEAKETLLIYGPEGAPWRRVLMVGLGKREDAELDRAREASGTAAKAARDAGAERAAQLVFGDPPAGVAYGDWVQAQAEGAGLATFQHLAYRTTDLDKVKQLAAWILVEEDGGRESELAAAARRGGALASAANYAKWLQGLPANHATPSFLAAQAQEIAKTSGLSCRIFEPDELEEMKMGALLSVARGSREPARLIVLEAKVREGAPWVAVVGKGVTFDSGGLSLKPAASMMEMKYDMSGAAAALGLMRGIRAAEPTVNVVAVVPATENLPGGMATKPGDIVKSYCGKTVEILNTDAEGRLILADALSYAERTYKPAAMIDLATLTGACVVALGHYAAGLLSSDEGLVERIQAAAQRSGEKVWRLPLWSEYKEHLKSQFADMKNIGDSNAGAGTITAAGFLSEFVEEAAWAHLDIAGTAYWDRDRAYMPKGPSGYGVRLLADVVRHWEA